MLQNTFTHLIVKTVDIQFLWCCGIVVEEKCAEENILVIFWC